MISVNSPVAGIAPFASASGPVVGNVVTIPNAAAEDAWLWTSESIHVDPLQQLLVSIFMQVPAGYPDVMLSVRVGIQDDAGAWVASGFWTIQATTAVTGWPLLVNNVATGTKLTVLVHLAEGASSGRKVQVSDLIAVATARPSEIVSCTLDQPTRREALIGAAGTPILTKAPHGPRTGQIVFLADTITDVLALTALYTTSGPITITGEPALAGWKHWAVGTIRSATERAIPGKPTRWLVTVPVQGV